MRISKSTAYGSSPLNGRHFEEIKEAEFRPHYDLQGLKQLRLRAERELSMRELYRGRAPYELLQNADDAGATKAAFILVPDGLAFAHDGKWFTLENFRSLADGWSDKDPGQCIGHKGLGFRSVLDITPSPYLVRVGEDPFFAVKFSWAMNNGHIQETLRRDSSLRPTHRGWTQYGRQTCPVMAIPGLASRRNLGEGAGICRKLKRGSYGDGFTTMFWFPAADPDIHHEARAELSPRPLTSRGRGTSKLVDFIGNEVGVLLPFLASIRSVEAYVEQERTASAVAAPDWEDGQQEVISVYVGVGDSVSTESFFQMRFAFDIPPHVKHKPDTPKAVRAMERAKAVLSVRLSGGQPVFDDGSCFHVYFPTEEKTGLGFVVHGDFFVKPDRTRLMTGEYNKWLLAKVADAAAGPFLTHLLQRYEPLHVFEALSPQKHAVTKSAERLVELFSSALRHRREPFIPTGDGMRRQQDAILPPAIDHRGFWEEHFSGTVQEALGKDKHLVRHGVDAMRSRAFFELAGVHVLKNEDLLGLMEVASQRDQSATWWYECYSYMATEDPKISSKSHSFFLGRRLLPTSNSTVDQVSEGGDDAVVCLPPAGPSVPLPKIFSPVFVFLDAELGNLLRDGDNSVRVWVLDRFNISRFEATDLLPRAIRSVNPALFSGDIPITPGELRRGWLFIKRIVAVSPRPLESPDFLRQLERFPLPAEGSVLASESLDPRYLIPAFLAYWPESYAKGDTSLRGIEGVRRIDAWFLGDLVTESGARKSDWKKFLGSIGVSSSPKLLNYQRLAVGGGDLPFAPEALSQLESKGFTGERQRDENGAVLGVLKNGGIWESLVREADLCDHDVGKVLQSLHALEGLGACSQAAQKEYESGDEVWEERLLDLTGALGRLQTPATMREEDSVFCRGGGPGGHSIEVGSYLQKQLAHHRWLPSSLGPASKSRCFTRLRSRRLISSGRQKKELGDDLIPYVVVDTIDELADLQRLGVDVLEDADSASPQALVRALEILGRRLSTPWGEEEILSQSGRWRLVRGAIQQIYQRLNRSEEQIRYPEDIQLAARSKDSPGFRRLPLYYAEPGSAVEQAFFDNLPLIDTDRSYPHLFDQFDIVSLVSGDTVNEDFVGDATAVRADCLCSEITERLSPYLLAAVIAKGDSTKSDMVIRRLEDRFEVRATKGLRVSYSLAGDASKEYTVDFPNFYLRRELRERRGAVQEAHFTLYVDGASSMSFFDDSLDADALGAELAPVFVDDASEALVGLFPRITSRYYYCHGDPEEMSEYLYRQIGISKDAQDMARGIGESDTGETSEPDISPPPIIVESASEETGPTSDDARDPLDAAKQESQDSLDGYWEAIEGRSDEDNTTSGTDHQAGKKGKPDVPRSKSGGPTREQQRRGLSGEQEIKRRLSLPGGWTGFVLLEDRREDGCGYDFLCECDGREVKLEVKTFTRNGYVVVTSSELQAAAFNRHDYYLVGVLADKEQQRSNWKTFVVPDPVNRLLVRGSVRVEAELRASAAELFEFTDEEG